MAGKESRGGKRPDSGSPKRAVQARKSRAAYRAEMKKRLAIRVAAALLAVGLCWASVGLARDVYLSPFLGRPVPQGWDMAKNPAFAAIMGSVIYSWIFAQRDRVLQLSGFLSMTWMLAQLACMGLPYFENPLVSLVLQNGWLLVLNLGIGGYLGLVRGAANLVTEYQMLQTAKERKAEEEGYQPYKW